MGAAAAVVAQVFRGTVQVATSMAPTPPQRVVTVARQFAAGLRERFGERLLEVRLFGSHARAEGRPDSDVDLFVLLDVASRADRSAVTDLAGDLWRETELRLSPTIMERDRHAHWLAQERPLVMEIAREGLVL